MSVAWWWHPTRYLTTEGSCAQTDSGIEGPGGLRNTSVRGRRWLDKLGPSIPEIYRQIGDYAGRVLTGEKPSDLPVLQPAKFDMAVNLRTAKSLGIDVPTSILLRADEVIE